MPEGGHNAVTFPGFDATKSPSHPVTKYARARPSVQSAVDGVLRVFGASSEKWSLSVAVFVNGNNGASRYHDAEKLGPAP